MGIVQQFLSPFYNRRDDEFGGSPEARLRFLEVVYEEIRKRAGDLSVITKVPSETPAPPAPLVTRKLSLDDGVEIARRLEKIGYDAVVPVQTSVVWDMSIVRGKYPDRAWANEALQEGYETAFGSPARKRLVALGNRIQSLQYPTEPAWNEPFCRRVRETVSIPVLAEGGIRGREEMDRLLGRRGAAGTGDNSEEPAADMVGLARPFYAEPRLGARLLQSEDLNPTVRALCESCNNCTVPQVTGAPGICRTPSVLRERGELERAGAYERR
jgi:2,4-dienoyl-CoA reductase-like NADH-dependent reductase (Old Yellow Enzyme family)